MEWFCEGCNKVFPEDEIEPYFDEHCHVVPYFNEEYDCFDPSPCGPVIQRKVDGTKNT